MPIMLSKQRRNKDERIAAINGGAGKVSSLRRIIESDKYLPLTLLLNHRFVSRFFESFGELEIVAPKEIYQPRYRDESTKKADEMIRELYETCTKGGLELVPFAHYIRDPLTKRLRDNILHNLRKGES